MKYYIVCLTLFLSSILYSSCDPCTKKVNCPAFDGDFLFQWFPYANANSSNAFYFSDGTDTDTIIIDKITQTEPHRFETSTGYGRKERYCDINGSIISKTDLIHPGWVSMNITHYISDEEQYGSEYVSFTFEKYHVNLRLEDDDPSSAYSMYGSGEYTATDFELIELNGISYNNVFIVSTEDTATARQQKIDKMYFAKGKGIIGYRTYPEQKQYWIQ